MRGGTTWRGGRRRPAGRGRAGPLRRRVVLVALLLGLAPPASALIQVGEIDTGVQITEVEVAGATLYAVDSNGRLLTFDLSDPATPVPLGELATEGSFRDLAVQAGRAYLTSQRTTLSGVPPSLEIVDVSDPTAPMRLSALEFPGGLYSVAVAGDLAYVTSADPRGLAIVDVSDPTAPSVVGVLPTNGTPLGITVQGTLGFLTVASSSGDNFIILDLTDPRAPVELGGCPLGSRGFGSEIVVAEGIAYVSGGDGRSTGPFFVVDVSDPSAPAQVAIAPFTEGSGLAARGDVVFLAGFDSLTAWNVANPSAPALLGLYSPPSIPGINGSLHDVAVAGGFAYVGGGETGPFPHFLGRISVIDLSRLDRPALLGSALVGGAVRTRDVAVEGDLALVALDSASPSFSKGIRLLDVSQPDAVVELGAFETPSPVRAVALEGSLAYLETGPNQLVGGANGLVIVDVSDPARPEQLAALELSPSSGSHEDVEIAGGRAYLASGGQLRIVDVSNPTAPALLADLPHPAFAVEVQRATAYVIGFDGLSILDVTDPAAPVELGHLAVLGPTGLEVREGLAYIAEARGLVIADVADPTAPFEVGISPPSGISDVKLDGDRAYVSNSVVSGVVDVSDPASPVFLGSVPYGGRRAVLADGRLYLAGGIPSFPPANFYIVDFGPEFRAALEVGIAILPGQGRALVNPKGHGVLPVALLGSADFDVAEVDRSTLGFGPLGAPPAHKQGGHPANVNGDAWRDLLSHYRIDATGIAVGDTRACVTGLTRDGTPFEGCAPLMTVPPCGLGMELAFLLPPLWALRRASRLRSPAARCARPRGRLRRRAIW